MVSPRCEGIEKKGWHLWVPYKVLNLGESECCYFCGVQRLRVDAPDHQDGDRP